jgi:hypothetical protein
MFRLHFSHHDPAFWVAVIVLALVAAGLIWLEIDRRQRK